MTDGQSEAQQQIDTSHPAIQTSVKDRIAAREKRLNELAGKIRHGVPGWTIEEQREVWWLLTGELFGTKRRCTACNATGVVWKFAGHFRKPTERECRVCHGTGYVGHKEREHATS